MEPTLRPGDLILVDRREATSLPLVGMLCVKRLQRLPGRQVRVSSDNPANGPFVIQVDRPEEGFAIHSAASSGSAEGCEAFGDLHLQENKGLHCG